jgi:hypothetical protein
MCVVNEAIENSVGDCGIADKIMPGRYGESIRPPPALARMPAHRSFKWGFLNVYGGPLIPPVKAQICHRRSGPCILVRGTCPINEW